MQQRRGLRDTSPCRTRLGAEPQKTKPQFRNRLTGGVLVRMNDPLFQHGEHIIKGELETGLAGAIGDQGTRIMDKSRRQASGKLWGTAPGTPER